MDSSYHNSYEYHNELILRVSFVRYYIEQYYIIINMIQPSIIETLCVKQTQRYKIPLKTSMLKVKIWNIFFLLEFFSGTILKCYYNLIIKQLVINVLLFYKFVQEVWFSKQK